MGNEIKFVNSHIYLGINLDVSTTLHPLLKSVNKRVTNKIFTLHKIQKCLTKEAAILIYKQTILPLIDYAGFMLIACNSEHKESLQKLQNDILQICFDYRSSNQVSIVLLHNECTVISIEKRMQKLMYLLSKSDKYIQAACRNARSANKVNFKVPTKITHVFDHSPYYIGTKLWENLPENVQKSDNVFVFKKEINRTHKAYKKTVRLRHDNNGYSIFVCMIY